MEAGWASRPHCQTSRIKTSTDQFEMPTLRSSGNFRTLWNGWPTSARMRSLTGACGARRCVLGCSSAEDRIEHYMVCNVAWKTLRMLPPRGMGMLDSQRTLHDASWKGFERWRHCTGCRHMLCDCPGCTVHASQRQRIRPELLPPHLSARGLERHEAPRVI